MTNQCTGQEALYSPCAASDTIEESSFLGKIKAFFTCIPTKKKPTPKKTTLAYVIGLTLLVAFFLISFTGLVIMWGTELYLDSITNAMTLKEGTEVFEAWSKPPVKPLFCGHVFNYTNIEDFAAGRDEKIKVQEVGPYCYRETQEKVNIEFHGEETITYSDTREHEFEPNYSKGKKDDVLVVPNMALIGAVAMTKDMSFISRLSISMMLKRALKYSDSMITVRAHDYFFGYDDKLIEMLTTVAKILNQDVPFEKFGLLSQRAARTNETITVRTGVGDLDRIGIVTEVNGITELDVWSEDECNRIDGSDGAFFPRSEINETATLYLFHKDLCRRMPFVYDKEVEFQDGVMAMRFHAAPNVYDTNGTCYCPDSGCAPKGVFDLSPCAKGAPIMMSFPHFLYADPSVREPFEGLHPDPKKHEFYIDIQRLLGFTLGTVSRLQLNIKVEKPRGSLMLKEFPEHIILPIVWLQVSAERLPPNLFRYIYHSSITVRQIQLTLKWGTLFMTLLSLVLIVYQVRRNTRINRKLEEKSPNPQELIPIGIKHTEKKIYSPKISHST